MCFRSNTTDRPTWKRRRRRITDPSPAEFSAEQRPPNWPSRRWFAMVFQDRTSQTKSCATGRAFNNRPPERSSVVFSVVLPPVFFPCFTWKRFENEYWLTFAPSVWFRSQIARIFPSRAGYRPTFVFPDRLFCKRHTFRISHWTILDGGHQPLKKHPGCRM